MDIQKQSMILNAGDQNKCYKRGRKRDSLVGFSNMKLEVMRKCSVSTYEIQTSINLYHF